MRVGGGECAPWRGTLAPNSPAARPAAKVREIVMKKLHQAARLLVRAAAVGALMLGLGPSQASPASLFDFDSSTPGQPPAIGSSSGNVRVEDDGTLFNDSGVMPWAFHSHLRLDTAGGVDAGGAFPSFSGFVYAFGAVAGQSFAYSVALLSELDANSATSAILAVTLLNQYGDELDLFQIATYDNTMSPGGPLGMTSGVLTRTFTAPYDDPNYRLAVFLFGSQPGCINGGDCARTAVILNGVEQRLPEPATPALAALALLAAAGGRRASRARAQPARR